MEDYLRTLGLSDNFWRSLKKSYRRLCYSNSIWVEEKYEKKECHLRSKDSFTNSDISDILILSKHMKISIYMSVITLSAFELLQLIEFETIEVDYQLTGWVSDSFPMIRCKFLRIMGEIDCSLLRRFTSSILIASITCVLENIPSNYSILITETIFDNNLTRIYKRLDLPIAICYNLSESNYKLINDPHGYNPKTLGEFVEMAESIGRKNNCKSARKS